ncbi:MAG: signal peptidase II [Bacillota bacterium]|nr:signal peptidase II [Bacillota bacterium]
MKISNIKTWLAVIFLIFLEQGIKIIINNNFLDRHIPIVPPLLYFDPMFNRDYSWFNSMLNLNIGKGLHVFVAAVMIIFIYLVYRYLNKRLGNRKAVNFMFAFLFSGAVCSLLDKVLWNGSLDYILVDGYFTFDLKDVYIDIFIGLMILMMLIKREAFKTLDDKELMRDFIRFVFRRS